MSKTKGNVIEPLQLVDEYGADAVRFTLSSMAVPGSDIPFSTDRMKGYSAFANKIWNAARFVLMNLKETDAPVDPDEIDGILRAETVQAPVEDRWILHRLNQVTADIAEALDKYRFHDASSTIYQFVWHEFCDWYIEVMKPVLISSAIPAAERDNRVKVLVHVLDYTLRILHPFMPFITEEIWQKLPHRGESIMVQSFPEPRGLREDEQASQSMQDLMDLIVGIRSARAEMNIEPKKELDLVLVIPDHRCRSLVQSNVEKIRLLARLQGVEFMSSLPTERILLKGVWRLGEFGLDLRGAIDLDAERERLRRERDRIKNEIEKILRKINSHEFISRAPESVVAENKARHAELVERLTRVESNIAMLPPA